MNFKSLLLFNIFIFSFYIFNLFSFDSQINPTNPAVQIWDVLKIINLKPTINNEESISKIIENGINEIRKILKTITDEELNTVMLVYNITYLIMLKSFCEIYGTKNQHFKKSTENFEYLLKIYQIKTQKMEEIKSGILNFTETELLEFCRLIETSPIFISFLENEVNLEIKRRKEEKNKRKFEQEYEQFPTTDLVCPIL